MVNVYAIGVFDLFHRGHVEFLKKAKELGDHLIVSINSDRIVGSYKRKPIYNETDRLEIVSSCRYVDEAFIIDTYDNRKVIQEYNIDKIVHGDDWDIEGYKEQIRVDDTYLSQQSTELVMVSYTGGVSTSEIIERIKKLDTSKT